MWFHQIQPMPLRMRKSAFNGPNFIFEVKWDGFRALAVIEHGHTRLISRNGHRFASFADLEKLISAGLPDTTAVIDGEICSLDKRGRPQFKNLLFHRGNVDYVDGAGIPLFDQICKHDLEGIVAKQKYAPYVTDREASTWFKIRNPRYSQWAGREKLFDRERSREPVPGWHSCVIACAHLEITEMMRGPHTSRPS